MNATTTLTIREFLNRNNEADDSEQPYVDLVRFGDTLNDNEANYLRLILQPDGRFDLIDCNCSDTGCDMGGDDPAAELIDMARDWIESVYPSHDRDVERESTEGIGDIYWHEFVSDAIPTELLEPR